MIFSAAQAANPGNPVLAQFIFSTASGLTVLLLAFLVRTIRQFLREHRWLIEKVEENSEAIRELLEERRPTRVQSSARPKRGRT